MEDIIMPTDEQVYSWWVDHQWAMAAPDLYIDGHQDGFINGLKWLIKNGYVQLTEEGKQYIPEHKKDE